MDLLYIYGADLSVEQKLASTHHSHHTSTPTHTHNMVSLDLWECLWKEASFKLQ